MAATDTRFFTWEPMASEALPELTTWKGNSIPLLTILKIKHCLPNKNSVLLSQSCETLRLFK